MANDRTKNLASFQKFAEKLQIKCRLNDHSLIRIISLLNLPETRQIAVSIFFQYLPI